MVLVPANVDNTVTLLPRFPSQTATIRATLKRRLVYKHHVYSLNIRPEMLRQAAKFLAQSPLYKNHISVNENWNLTEFPHQTNDATGALDEQHDSHSTNENISNPTTSTADQDTLANPETTVNEEQDDWSEDETEPVSGQADTMLTTQDFVELGERDVLYNFAPAEGNVPVSVLLEENCEELAFPGVFVVPVVLLPKTEK